MATSWSSLLATRTLLLLANEREQELAIVSTRVILDPFSQTLAVHALESRLDLRHINLAARNDNALQSAIICAQALHGLHELLGKVSGRILDQRNDCKHSSLHVTRKLTLENLLHGLGRNPLVLVEDGAEFIVAPQAKNGVEDRLISTPSTLASLEELLGVRGSLCGVDWSACGSAVALAERDHQTLEVATGLTDNVTLKIASSELVLVSLLDRQNFCRLAGAHDLNQCRVIRTQTLHRISQPVGITNCGFLQEIQENCAEIAACLTRELCDEILAKHGLVCSLDGHALFHAAISKNVDDGALICSHSFHGLHQG
eukprot:m.244049 g.244049  ORF g.244049 m.244049 type:complete len:315 (+) comp54451_c0_seq7:143-1087(+)